MLKPAIMYKAALPNLFAQASMDKNNLFFTENYWTFDSQISDSNWDKHQFVSIDKSDNIIGYFAVSVDRPSHFAYNLSVIRFLKEGRYDIAFAKDFKHFFILLFTYYEYRKLNFSVCVGSPHEPMYDRFVKKYGGNIVGIQHEHFRLANGMLLDYKLYELFRWPFLEKLLSEKDKHD